MNHVVFISFKLLSERKRQAIVSVLGVAIGVTAFIVMSSVMMGFQTYFIEQAVDINAHITLKNEEQDEADRILRVAYGDGVISEVLGSKPKETKDKIVDYKFIISKYMKSEDVKGVAPHLTGQAIVRYGIKEKSVNIIGIDPQLEVKASIIDRFMEFKRLNQLNVDRNSIILGSLVARDLGVRETGKKVTLVAPNGSVHVLKVVDFFNSGITSLDQTRAYLHLRTLQTILDRPNQVNELVFKIKNVDDAERLSRVISRETGYYAESWQKAYSNFLKIFRMQNWITYMIVFAILVVSAFGIFNIMMMTVLEKKRDIAILKAIGFEDREITWIFVFQGVFIGFVGATLGCLFGYLLQEWLSSIRFEVVGLIRARGFILDRSPVYFAYGFVFAMFFSTLASFYPSFKASKLFPVDIFRSGG
ncbi:MAG: ABC transporter [Deltaproteobacteria bacterium]|jgi:lipoprotein-releasing system permease protein|nr:MAG: ABC transporter [Deltaproteobacteria bacterium]